MIQAKIDKPEVSFSEVWDGSTTKLVQIHEGQSTNDIHASTHVNIYVYIQISNVVDHKRQVSLRIRNSNN